MEMIVYIPPRSESNIETTRFEEKPLYIEERDSYVARNAFVPACKIPAKARASFEIEYRISQPVGVAGVKKLHRIFKSLASYEPVKQM